MQDRGRNDRDTMADVSHENPHTGATLGDVFRRGPAVADGGKESDEEGSEETVDPDADSMADVDHTSPNADVNEVWTRGPGVPEKREADR